MIKYYVNEKRRTVIAVLENTTNDCINYARKNVGVPDVPNAILKVGKMPERFRVEIVCSPEDTFDVEKGKQIAKRHILANYWRSRHKAMRKVADAMKGYAKTMKKFSEQLQDEAKD